MTWQPPDETPSSGFSPTPSPDPPVGWDAPPPTDAPTPGTPAATTPGPPPVRWEAPTPQPVQEVAPGLIYAGALARIVAYVIDIILIGIVTALVFGVLLTLLSGSGASGDATTVAYVLLTSALELVYFIGFWTSSARSTLGMRIVKLQIGNAADGRTLTPEQAVRRWIAMGFPLTLLGVVPSLAGIASTLFLLWAVVLAIGVATSPTKQGIHDRFARSAIVQPVGQSNAAVIGCLILIAIFAVVPIIAIIALYFLGGQVATMLSDIGTSI